jgi:hypothetical protein
MKKINKKEMIERFSCAVIIAACGLFMYIDIDLFMKSLIVVFAIILTICAIDWIIYGNDE